MKIFKTLFVLSFSLLITAFIDIGSNEEHKFLNWFMQQYGPHFSKDLELQNGKPLLYTSKVNNGAVSELAYILELDTITGSEEFVSQGLIISPENDTIQIDQINELVLTNSEKSCIKNQLGTMPTLQWKKNIFKNSVLLDSDSLKSLLSKSGSGWEKAYPEKYSTGFFTFSKPIFIRNSTICIFFCSYSCGYLCGNGELSVFIKKDGTWKKSFNVKKWKS